MRPAPVVAEVPRYSVVRGKRHPTRRCSGAPHLSTQVYWRTVAVAASKGRRSEYLFQCWQAPAPLNPILVSLLPSRHAASAVYLHPVVGTNTFTVDCSRCTLCLVQVHIPTVKVTSRRRVKGTDEQESVTEDRSRGFGFVQFLCPKDAARVVKVRGTYSDFHACVIWSTCE